MQLRVHVIKAILTHNTQIGSEMDPFLVLKLGTQQRKGQTFEEAGDMPTFDEHFDFTLRQNHTKLHLIVYDEDTTVDDLVGEVEIDLKTIIIQPFTEKRWYSLKYNGKKPAGKIMVEFECRKDGRVEAPSKREVKQILRPNIHPIGMAPQHVGSGKLYCAEEDKTSRTMGNYQRSVGSVVSSRSLNQLPVYSFRNNSTINNNKNNHNNSLHNGQASTLVSSVSNSSQVSSSTSSRCCVPTYSAYNNFYYSNNDELQNRNIYNSYQEPQKYSHFNQGQNRSMNFNSTNSVNWCGGLGTYGSTENCLRRY